MATLTYISDRMGMITDDDLGVEPPRLRHFRKANQRLFESAQETISRIDVENVMRRDWHQYKMARVGRPRLPPDSIQQLIGKRPGEKVAASMIVFGPLGQVYNLELAPYFLPPPEPPLPKPERKRSRWRIWG